MQEGNKSLGMLKIVQFGREISMFKSWFHCDINRMYQEKIEAIRIAPKHNNSLETSPYAIQKHHVMHQSDFTLQIPS